jgi:hypothetical protein
LAWTVKDLDDKIIITLCIFRPLNSKLSVKLADGKISRERTVYY